LGKYAYVICKYEKNNIPPIMRFGGFIQLAMKISSLISVICMNKYDKIDENINDHACPTQHYLWGLGKITR
jgi:hypothetical protein